MNQAQEMTALEQAIVSHLEAQADWCSMRDIARALGRKGDAPLPYDRAVVRGLVEAGKLDTETRLQGAVKTYAVFRIKAG